MRSHTTAAVLQYVKLYSLLVLPAIEHANEGAWMRAWDTNAASIQKGTLLLLLLMMIWHQKKGICSQKGHFFPWLPGAAAPGNHGKVPQGPREFSYTDKQKKENLWGRSLNPLTPPPLDPPLTGNRKTILHNRRHTGVDVSTPVFTCVGHVHWVFSRQDIHPVILHRMSVSVSAWSNITLPPSGS